MTDYYTTRNDAIEQEILPCLDSIPLAGISFDVDAIADLVLEGVETPHGYRYQRREGLTDDEFWEAIIDNSVDLT